MSKIYDDIDSGKILNQIKDYLKILSCIDISEEFLYDDVFVYDCMVQTSMINIAIKDGEQLNFATLRDFPLFEKEIDTVIGTIVNSLENEFKSKYKFDYINFDYQLYTFFDYVENIKFILILDFSNRDRHSLKSLRNNIIAAQLSGKSKYLN